MNDSIYVGHPFYFPTQVVLVDDDPAFLDSVSLMLDENFSFRLFASASEALDHVNQAHQHVNFLQRCYSQYKTGPQDSDSLSHVDISKLYQEIFNPARFQTCATVIVDYAMPEMNGLEFLMSVKNPFVRKVLLTGKADTELAIKAFNKQLIDQFIDKHDPQLKSSLNDAINAFQDQYFRNSFKLITDPIVASNHDNFLTDAAFQNAFTLFRYENGIAEYYLIDNPGSGYVLVDNEGCRSCLLVFTETMLQQHASDLENSQAPDYLVDAVRRGDLLPAYNWQDEELKDLQPYISQWEEHYARSFSGVGSDNYITALLTDEQLPEQYQGDMLPFGDFLENNLLNREILH